MQVRFQTVAEAAVRVLIRGQGIKNGIRRPTLEVKGVERLLQRPAVLNEKSPGGGRAICG